MIARITNASTFINSPAIKMESRAGEILRYIHANYNQDISLEQLSKEFFISKSRLSEVFKQSTGFSVGNYVIAYRIKIACTLLQKRNECAGCGLHGGVSYQHPFYPYF